MFSLLCLIGCSSISNQDNISSKKTDGIYKATEDSKTSVTSLAGLADNENGINPLPTSTPRSYWQEAGYAEVPILLFHHITIDQPKNGYSVSLTFFKKYIDYLKEFNYHTITLAQLSLALYEGAELPLNPVIITFDDGNRNVFDNAFPLMSDYGFVGVVYVITNRINLNGFLTEDQLHQMIDSGWEVGSHGRKHIDLVEQPEALRDEVGNSKKELEQLLGIQVISFAYPFGKADNKAKDWVKQIGYRVALGLGISNKHSASSRFYLSRREVKSELPLDEFIRLLEIN